MDKKTVNVTVMSMEQQLGIQDIIANVLNTAESVGLYNIYPCSVGTIVGYHRISGDERPGVTYIVFAKQAGTTNAPVDKPTGMAIMPAIREYLLHGEQDGSYGKLELENIILDMYFDYNEDEIDVYLDR